MMPVGPLMKEHRLIERMIRVMKANLEMAKKEGRINVSFVNTAIDFIKTYADKCHHGKEEDILFRELAKKNMSDGHKRTMEELIQEHKMGRNNIKKLAAAKEEYAQGKEAALGDIISNMDTLVRFYPKHIEKEDKHFFVPSMDYFTQEERDKMLVEMGEFDKEMIHRRYTEVVEVHGG